MDQIGLISLIGLIGLVLGSFVNVLIYRLNTLGVPKFWQGRSFCPNCKHTLNWFDNIPVISFIVIRGRCRYCKKPISWQYPVVELTTAIAFVLLVQLGKLDLIYFILTIVFLVIFFSDVIYGLIPDEMIYLGVFIAIVYQLAASPSLLAPSLLIAILVRFGFLLIVWLTKYKGMGLGDIKLGFLMGLVLGWPRILIAIWAGFIVGGLVSVVLLVLKRLRLSATIPLGPFLIIGTLISALWTDKILRFIGIG